MDCVYLQDHARQGLQYLAGAQDTGATARLSALLFGKRVGYDAERAALLFHLVEAGYMTDLSVEDSRYRKWRHCLFVMLVAHSVTYFMPGGRLHGLRKLGRAAYLKGQHSWPPCRTTAAS